MSSLFTSHVPNLRNVDGASRWQSYYHRTMQGHYWQGDLDEIVLAFMNRAGVALVEHKHHEEAAWNERGGFPRALLDTASARKDPLPLFVCVRWPEALRWKLTAANDRALALLSDLPAWAQVRNRIADDRDELLTREIVVEEAGYWHLQGIVRGIEHATIAADLERLQETPLLDPPGESRPRYRLEAFQQRTYYADPVAAWEQSEAHFNDTPAVVVPIRRAAPAEPAATIAAMHESVRRLVDPSMFQLLGNAVLLNQSAPMAKITAEAERMATINQNLGRILLGAFGRDRAA